MIGRSGSSSWLRPARWVRRPRTSTAFLPQQSLRGSSSLLLLLLLVRMPRTDDSTPQKGEPKPSPSLLSEEFLDLIHPGLGAGVVSIAVPLADHLELAQQFPLSLGQVYRCLDDDVAKQIAVFPTAHAANALSAQPKYLPRLSLGGDSDLRRTVQRGNFDLSAERCRRETHRHLAVQVVVVALKNRMGLDLDLHVKIACRSAIHPGLAFA